MRTCPRCGGPFRESRSHRVICRHCDYLQYRETYRAARAFQHRVLRDAVLNHYGYECQLCGFSDERALQIDHINNDGAADRRRLTGGNRGGSEAVYYYLRDHGWPEGYQTLCANCNAIKRDSLIVRRSFSNRIVRDEALNQYGDFCAWCKFSDERALQIDHIGNNGAVERRASSRGSGKFYRWLRARGWPHGYQTLCVNCNAIKQVQFRRGELGRCFVA